MSKWQEWHNSLTPNTKEYLKQQAIWHDRDLFKFSFITFLLGLVIGLCL
jgi:hypothetical protein